MNEKTVSLKISETVGWGNTTSCISLSVISWLDGHAGAVNDFAARIAEHVHAQHLAVLRADDHLAQARAAFVLGDEATRVGHRQLGDLVFDSLGLGLLFGQADAGHFGIRVDYARNRVVAHPVRAARQVVDDDLALAGWPCGPASRTQVISPAAKTFGAFVRILSSTLTAPRFISMPRFSRPSPAVTGAAADAHQDLVAFGRQRLPVLVDIDYLVAADFGHLAVEVELDTLLGIDVLQHGADFAVQSAENLRQHLDDGHFGAETVEEAGELHADHTSADDYQ